MKRRYVGYLYMAPCLAILIVLIIYPLYFSFRISLTDFTFGRPFSNFVGFDNYVQLFHDPIFVQSLTRTIFITIVAVFVEFICGLGSALILTRKFRGQNLIRTLVLLPMMISPIIVALIWLLMYQPDFSVLDYLIQFFKINPPMWLTRPPWPLIGVTITEIWEWTPFFTMVCLSGLASLPIEPYEAALTDGASGWQIFWKITLPMLTPLLLIGLLIRMIDVFRIFDIIYIMTEGGPGDVTSTMSIFVHRTGFIYRHLGSASAASYIMIIVITILTLILIRLLNRVGSQQ
ncbi:MAG: sugar ABC transporter permease [Candidatus Atribacteria bacterium]|nr:sugar ABC transporter permease [Candidatus Atribacteria bacterium]